MHLGGERDRNSNNNDAVIPGGSQQKDDSIEEELQANKEAQDNDLAATSGGLSWEDYLAKE